MCLLPVAVPHSCWRRSDAESSCGFKKTRKWGICYSDMPVAGIYDAAALHLDLKMLESIGPLPASAFELIRKAMLLLKRKEVGWFHFTVESPLRRIVAVCKSILVDSGGS